MSDLQSVFRNSSGGLENALAASKLVENFKGFARLLKFRVCPLIIMAWVPIPEWHR